MAQLDKLKLMLGVSDSAQDGLLEMILDDVETDLLIWTNRAELPAQLEPTQRLVAVMRYNKQGAEGESSRTEGGISRTFEDLPTSLQQAIRPFVKAKVARYANDA